MDKFEKYLRDNKEHLDIPEVNPRVFLAIENKVLQKRHRRSRIFVRSLAAAAAVLLVAVLSLGGLYRQSKQDLEEVMLAQQGFSKLEFTREITQKTKKLEKAKIPKERAADFQILLSQLEFLDKQYHDYLNYTEEHGYQEFIGNQILNYYKSKIELLEKIQSEIEKIEGYERKYDIRSEKTELDLSL